MKRADRPSSPGIGCHSLSALLVSFLLACSPAADEPGDVGPADGVQRDGFGDDTGSLDDRFTDGPVDGGRPDSYLDGMPLDAAPAIDMAEDAMRAADMTLDGMPGDSLPTEIGPDARSPDGMSPPDTGPLDATLLDLGPLDLGPPDAGRPGPPTGLHVIDTDPPHIGWLRDGRAEVSTFDPVNGLGPAVGMGPVSVDHARFVAVDDGIRMAWSDADGTWLDGMPPQRVGDGALRGLVALGDAVALLTTDADPGRARLIRIGAPGERVRVFDVEPDASELLGLAVAGDEIGVMTGDARIDGLYVRRFDGSLRPLGAVEVCDFGCDRPNARLAGGPELAVLYQSTGRLHRVIGDDRADLGEVVRGGALDLRFADDWIAAWSTPGGRGPGVFIDGVEVYVGPVREVVLIDDRCAVWVADEVGWGCR